MNRIFSWIKRNKLATFLIIVILLFAGRSYLNTNLSTRTTFDKVGAPSAGRGGSLGMLPQTMEYRDTSESMVIPPNVPPDISSEDRKVIQNSSLSLLVDNVEQVKDMILQKTEEIGGFMVSVNVNNPQEAAKATVVVRVPADQLDETLDYFRGLSVRVVSETLSGRDVTDQYTDIQARMETLQTTKAKFEDILDQATEIDDILRVQRELINLQSQIDNLKGQEQYIERNAQMARLTIYLSTDELALPYTPDEVWRPQVIFKQAVRSLIGTVRSLGSLGIWLGVYSVIWVPALVVVVWWRRRKRNRTSNPPTRRANI